MGIFSRNTEPKCLFDFLDLSLQDIKGISYKMIAEDITPDGKPMKDYSGKLPKTILKVFDHITLKIFSDKFRIDGSVLVHAFFKIIENELTTNKIAFVTNQFYSFFGKDNYNKKGWAYSEEDNINEDYWSGRTYTFDQNGYRTKEINEGEYQVCLSYDSDYGLELKVLFLSSLLAN